MSKTSQIDLGLVISGMSLKPGERRTVREIAAFCGCSASNIFWIEQAALKKLRNKILYTSAGKNFDRPL